MNLSSQKCLAALILVRIHWVAAQVKIGQQLMLQLRVGLISLEITACHP